MKKPSKPKVIAEDDSEIIIRPSTQMGDDSERSERQVAIPTEAAVLAVRNVVVFPGTVIPLVIGRAKSQRLIDKVLPNQKVIVTLCQKKAEVDDPAPDDLYQVGAAAMVLKLLRMEQGSQSIIVHGLMRVQVEQWLGTEPYLRAKIRVLADTVRRSTELEALVMNARNAAQRAIQLSPNIPEEAGVVLNNIDDPGSLADFLASNLQLDVPVRQELLAELDVSKRLRMVGKELQHQVEVLELSSKIHNQVKANIDKSQREYFLQEQLKAIRKELGQADEKTAELNQLRESIKAAGMPKPVKTEVVRELSRLEQVPTMSPEYNVIRTYLDWMTELPWSRVTEDILDVNRARKILNRDHYDLEKVKRRVLEFLAVRKLAPESRGPILCFVGPPGVGKTSLGQSIARAMGRKFIRMSLGGMRDEAELRGHRRTYIGAMPGRVVQEIRKAGTANPVFMLDELDKVGADFRGDPTSALLEVLDPAQNNTFQDHYLNVPFDLSKVLFIGTANYLAPVPPALRDRLEVIELPGYTRREKLRIAAKYLVPRQCRENGLKRSQARWNEQAIARIIEDYTREAGVRELERQIGTVCRGVAALIAGGKAKSRTVTGSLVGKMLGPSKYESEIAQRTSVPGVATGLAYTPAGGEIIFIEAAAYRGKGALMLTGQIGDVMKESAQAALSLVKSHGDEFGVNVGKLAELDIHIHVPAGAVPKDGPSAGVAIFTALASLLSNRPARSNIAMTGEITLRGLVLPVGGVKEKVLAAKRAGVQSVILPHRNRKDIVDVPPDARKSLRFYFVKKVHEVLRCALVEDRKPLRRYRRKAKAAAAKRK
ncbi:MAG: endopeptidase La [Planctomycetota bacterium]|nr:endopeptidase La [Planctomycetota bacterium]